MRIASCQLDVEFGQPERNAATLVETVANLADGGVDLAVFPEAFLTGYCVGTAEQAKGIALPVEEDESGMVHSAHPAILEVRHVAMEYSMHLCVGFAGVDKNGLYNGALFVWPDGSMKRYLKTHLPHLGYDRFVRTGNSLPLFDTKFGKVGILICFDLRHPEASRVLAKAGADIILLPTNWPEGAQMAAEHVAITRATENKVFLASCNRVGTENGTHFIGLSKIVDPYGRVLASAGTAEEILRADIDLSLSRDKRNVIIPGEYEITIFESRRPDLYSTLCE